MFIKTREEYLSDPDEGLQLKSKVQQRRQTEHKAISAQEVSQKLGLNR